MQCPICRRRSRGQAFCRCGYELATGDVRSVVLKARRQRAHGRRELLTGFALLAIIPITIFIALPVLGVARALLLVAAPQLIAGIGFAAAGGYKRLAASRMLARALEPAALPMARLLE